MVVADDVLGVVVCEKTVVSAYQNCPVGVLRHTNAVFGARLGAKLVGFDALEFFCVGIEQRQPSAVG